MDEHTVHALNAINRSFYSETAGDFDATRSEPWPGWMRLLPLIEQQRVTGALHVLDVGCGNGRFGAFLADRLAPDELRYTGIDSSEPLLSRARTRALPFAAVDFVRADLVETPECLPSGPYALTALFGVLHHIPGIAHRKALLRRLGERLAPGGLLVVTCWEFAAFSRFREKLIPWRDYNRTARDPIDVEQLETGDHLLPWGDHGGAVRYCHFTSEGDMRQLLSSLSFDLVSSYSADGRENNLNRYFICRFSNTQEMPKKG
jgi:SAM-dependent methyltransferase